MSTTTLTADRLQSSDKSINTPSSKLILEGNIYATVEDLKKAKSLSEGQQVLTQGYYNVGDSGATLYTINSKSESLYSIKIGKLYANPILGDEVNLRQCGLKEGGDIQTFFYNIKEFVNKVVYIPAGNYTMHQVRTHSNIIRGKYDFRSVGKVHISCYTKSKHSHPYAFLYFNNSFLDGTDFTVHDVDIHGTKIKSKEIIGSIRINNPGELPEGLQEGDMVIISNTRGIETENRSNTCESQVNCIEALKNGTIELKEPCYFNYDSGLEYTGTVLEDAQYWDKEKRTRKSLQVKVKFEKSPINNNRDEFGFVTFNNGENNFRGYPAAFDQESSNSGTYWFTWTLEGDAPKKGDTFKVTIDSYLRFLPRIEFSMTGDITFDLDTSKTSEQNNKQSNYGINLTGIINPVFRGISFKHFGYGPLTLAHTYNGQVSDCIFDGRNRQIFNGFSMALLGTPCHGLKVTDCEFYSWGQAVNFQGFSVISTRNIVRNNKYLGGGQSYDGSQKYYPDAGSGKNEKAETSFYTSHGGGFWNIIENNIVINAQQGFGSRGRQEVFHNNHIYGACKTPFSFGQAQGNTYTNNHYQAAKMTSFDKAETLTRHNSIPECMFQINLQMETFEGDKLFVYPHFYPTTITDNKADMLKDNFIKLNGKNSQLLHLVWGRNTVARPYNVDSGEKNFTMLGTNEGTHEVELSHCRYLGGDAILNVTPSEKSGTWSAFNPQQVYPKLGTFLQVSDVEYILNIPNDDMVKVPITGIAQYVIQLTGMPLDRYSAPLIAAWTHGGWSKFASTNGFTQGDEVNVTDKKLSGTTGKKGKLTFYVEGSHNAYKTTIYVENRLGESILYRLRVS
ncbi:hypothetical protein R84981_001407 [Carnimonas sp. R-84981]|uniref:hypothetical protein n=1 Tax=Carnimonas bestiolae TaxID=3402172 RepID=UPI003EDCAFC0